MYSDVVLTSDDHRFTNYGFWRLFVEGFIFTLSLDELWSSNIRFDQMVITDLG